MLSTFFIIFFLEFVFTQRITPSEATLQNVALNSVLKAMFITDQPASTDACTGYGIGGGIVGTRITCDENGYVSALELAARGGVISPEIGQLRKVLSLRITAEIGSVGVSGTIPTEITQLRALTNLDIVHNPLHGRFPDVSQFTNLETCQLTAEMTELRFCCPIPELTLFHPCATHNSAGIVAHTTCMPLMSCTGVYSPSAPQILDQFNGQYKLTVKTSAAVAKKNDKDPLVVCSHVYENTGIVHIVDHKFKVTLDDEPVVPSDSALYDLTPLPLTWLFNAEIIAYDDTTGRIALLKSLFFLEERKTRLDADCAIVEFNEKGIKIFIPNIVGIPGNCDVLDTRDTIPSTAQCRQRTVGLFGSYQTVREKFHDTFTYARHWVVLELESDDARTPTLSSTATVDIDNGNKKRASTIDTAVNTAANTLPPGAAVSPSSDDSTTLAIVVSVVIVAVCVSCIAAICVVLLLVKRKQSNDTYREANPMFHTTTMTAPGTPQFATCPDDYFGGVAATPPPTKAEIEPLDAIPAPLSSSGTQPIKTADMLSLSTFAQVELNPDDIVKHQKIGEGAFGVVYSGTWNGRRVAIKECLPSRGSVNDPYDYSNISSKELEDFKHEARRMQQLTPHRNIVPFYGICLKPTFSIVCEFCEGGSLDTLLYESPNPLPLRRCWGWIRGIAAGTQHLHREGIVHRDLAARNVLLSANDTAKLTDFGLARQGNGDYVSGGTKSQVGPVRWMAPEQLSSLQYSTKSDSWMFGVVIFEIMSRELPWSKEEIPGAIFKIMSKEKLKLPDATPSVLKELTDKCWQQNPADRPSLNRIVEILNASTDANGNVLSRSAAISNRGRGSGSFECPICHKIYPTKEDLDFHHKKRHV